MTRGAMLTGLTTETEGQREAYTDDNASRVDTASLSRDPSWGAVPSRSGGARASARR